MRHTPITLRSPIPPARRRRLTTGIGAVGALAALLASMLCASAGAAPKPGFPPGTWVGTGTISGTTTDGPFTTHLAGGISFRLRVAADRRVSGSGTWKLTMLGSSDGPSSDAVDSTMTGSAAVALRGSATAVTFSGLQRVTGEIRMAGRRRPISFAKPFTGRLQITRAGACRVTGATAVNGGGTLRWSATLEGAATCRT